MRYDSDQLQPAIQRRYRRRRAAFTALVVVELLLVPLSWCFPVTMLLNNTDVWRWMGVAGLIVCVVTQACGVVREKRDGPPPGVLVAGYGLGWTLAITGTLRLPRFYLLLGLAGAVALGLHLLIHERAARLPAESRANAPRMRAATPSTQPT